MIWSKIKLYLYGAIGLLVTGLAITVRVLSAKNSRLTRKVETAEAKVEHQKAVLRADKEADEQADQRLVDAKNEISKKGSSDELENPNEW
jgi:hypothetical protein